jgi:fluoride ion exporter CrcB/FEX
MGTLEWLALGALGALGAIARWGLMAVAVRGGHPALVGIVIANTVGSFLAGIFLAHPVSWSEPVAIGVFGALTTFSTIAQGLADDLEAQGFSRFGRALLIHLITGLSAVALGFALGSSLASAG